LSGLLYLPRACNGSRGTVYYEDRVVEEYPNVITCEPIDVSSMFDSNVGLLMSPVSEHKSHEKRRNDSRKANESTWNPEEGLVNRHEGLTMLGRAYKGQSTHQ
jgi:hypothetical protein